MRNEWARDPKHLGFVLARYKFVSKMLAGYKSVLEVGAGDGWASHVVRASVGGLVCSDRQAFDGVVQHDFLTGPMRGFSAAFSLDVIEHIEPALTAVFLRNLAKSVEERGVVIVGSPSLESQPYATEKEGHVNCMTATELCGEMRKHFNPVFSFGMNDEMLHVGFDQMRHYNFAIGVR